MTDVQFTDNSEEVLRILRGATMSAAEIVGGMWESNAKGLVSIPRRLAPELRNSISHRVEDTDDGPVLMVGSNMEEAPYVELGTGRHYDPPPEWMENHAKGGKGQAGLEYWVYFDELEGKFKIGTPQEPHPFLRPAMLDNIEQYKQVIRGELENAEG